MENRFVNWDYLYFSQEFLFLVLEIYFVMCYTGSVLYAIIIDYNIFPSVSETASVRIGQIQPEDL